MFRYAQKMDLPALFFIVTALLLLSTPYAALDAMRTLALKTVASFSDALRLPGLPKNSNIRSLSFASGAASGENILQEAPDINSSSNPNWWLDSGAVFYSRRTIPRGPLKAISPQTIHGGGNT